MPAVLWNEIEAAYKSGKELSYNGYRYHVMVITRLLHTNGETALAQLKLVRDA